MKTISSIFTLFLAFLLLCSNTEADSGSSLEARLNTYKHECKQLIKPARYEGSRITFYGSSKESQKKSVEAFLILDTEYKFAFSGKECSTKLSIRFYDAQDEKKRTLLKEVKGAQNKNTIVSSRDLTSAFHKKVNKNERLKIVYIEYEIAGGVSKNEAVVMVVGYDDK